MMVTAGGMIGLNTTEWLISIERGNAGTYRMPREGHARYLLAEAGYFSDNLHVEFDKPRPRIEFKEQMQCFGWPVWITRKIEIIAITGQSRTTIDSWQIFLGLKPMLINGAVAFAVVLGIGFASESIIRLRRRSRRLRRYPCPLPRPASAFKSIISTATVMMVVAGWIIWANKHEEVRSVIYAHSYY